MIWKTRTARAALLAAPLGVWALGAQAADIIGTLKQDQQFSTLEKAIGSAGIAQSLQGKGPYTIFAPTNEAFDRLPQGALDTLMQQGHQDQLKKLLQYHVIDGQEITAKDAVGKQTRVDTVGGDQLSVDGTGQMVMLVPTGLTVTRVGDQVFVERDVAAVTAPTVEVAPADQQGQQSGQSGSSSRQQQAKSQSGQSGQSGGSGQQNQQQASTETDVTSRSGMPATEHQEQVLKTEPSTEQQRTMPQDTGMPSSPHQEQVLRGQQPGEQGGSQASAQGNRQDMGVLREATVVEPDIQADNGVIHAIDAVLVPQSVLSLIENPAQSGQSEQGKTQQSQDKQG